VRFPDWPDLPFSEWEKTCDTVHMWTQIVGKTRMVLDPLVNHWWNVTLYVTPSGLTTSTVPYKDKSFDVEFDFIAHQVRIRTSDGRRCTLALYARSVADFYGDYMSALRFLGIEVTINTNPVEFDDLTPYTEDQHHASYDRNCVEQFHRILVQTDRVLKVFRTRFIGKCSPVHFFWGSFDLAVTRFSGRIAPQKPDADPVGREAYSHEVISCGFWPGDRRFPHAAFYSYTAPPPVGLNAEPLRPEGAYWDDRLSEFILTYDHLRRAAQPEAALLQFCQSTYEAGAKLAQWDRVGLERMHDV
jgi:hypothetical protein